MKKYQSFHTRRWLAHRQSTIVRHKETAVQLSGICSAASELPSPTHCLAFMGILPAELSKSQIYLLNNSAKNNSMKFSDDAISESEAATKIQNQYKSFRSRRWLAEYKILEKWWETLESVELKWSSILFFDSKGNKTALHRWRRAITRAAKLGKGSSKSDDAQMLAVPKHWLEALDPRHRYGHNLHFYFVEWNRSSSRQPFFYWLDLGEGKKVDLAECKRKSLQQQCIKYISPMERKNHEVIVEGGKLFHEQTREPLDTGGEEWIFVLSTSGVLYANKKHKGSFHHSSFLAGAATRAAGKLVLTSGTLEKIIPHSGHYRPTKENFKNFISFLEDRAVNLSNLMESTIDEEECLIEDQQGSNNPSSNSLDSGLSVKQHKPTEQKTVATGKRKLIQKECEEKRGRGICEKELLQRVGLIKKMKMSQWESNEELPSVAASGSGHTNYLFLLSTLVKWSEVHQNCSLDWKT